VRLSEAGDWKLEPRVDRTAVFADLDHDGDIDVVLAGLHEPIRVLRNNHDAKDDWIVVVPRDVRAGRGNRHAIGAEVRVKSAGAATGAVTVQRRWIVGGGPFQSNNAPEAHFGLGAGADPVDVEVVFPDGRVESRKGVARGTRVLIDRTID